VPKKTLDKRVASVFFDCDSTLTRLEGIDDLARHASPEVAAAVAALTRDAMEGKTPLEAVYARRLDAVRPTRRALWDLGARYVGALVAGARETVATLAARGVVVGIVSGGPAAAVRAVGDALGVAPDRVHAVEIHFDDTGAYAGFDADSPLVQSGGKAVVLARPDLGPRPLCFVGDGVSDLEAAPVVEFFVGYGGVVRRERVAREADAYLEDEDLRRLLDIVPLA
jgi:phosphoserine phosphatase